MYDLEGNGREWTVEAELTLYRIGRGGCYDSNEPPSCRTRNRPTYNTYINYCSSATLYIK